jgi:predicted AAA+ superfamily ATPase
MGAEYISRPSLLRERYAHYQGLIVIDEVQKVPAILEEVHWLIENRGLSFILTGSSARKLRRGHGNLLGGRAWRRTMTRLSFVEVEGYELEKVMGAPKVSGTRGASPCVPRAGGAG